MKKKKGKKNPKYFGNLLKKIAKDLGASPWRYYIFAITRNSNLLRPK
jgi:hypothetical protein